MATTGTRLSGRVSEVGFDVCIRFSPGGPAWLPRASGGGQNTSGGFHLSTRRSTRVTIANAATAIPAPRMTVA